MDGVLDFAMFVLTEYRMSIIMTALAIIVLVGFARIGRQKKRRMESK